MSRVSRPALTLVCGLAKGAKRAKKPKGEPSAAAQAQVAEEGGAEGAGADGRVKRCCVVLVKTH